MSGHNFGDAGPCRENTGSKPKKKPLISVNEVIWLLSGLTLGVVGQVGYSASQEYRSSKGK